MTPNAFKKEKKIGLYKQAFGWFENKIKRKSVINMSVKMG